MLGVIGLDTKKAAAEPKVRPNLDFDQFKQAILNWYAEVEPTMVETNPFNLHDKIQATITEYERLMEEMKYEDTSHLQHLIDTLRKELKTIKPPGEQAREKSRLEKQR
jgi:hypothetical protein